MKLDLFSEPVKETVNNKRDIDTEDSTLKIIDATELAKTSYTEYSRYVAGGRSYPQVIDGAKSSYRRAIYGMYKGQGQKKMKVAETRVNQILQSAINKLKNDEETRMLLQYIM